MANKRAKKKTARKRTARQKKQTPWLRWFALLLLLVALLISGLYYFGSFETRAKMERIAMATLNTPRTHGSMPAPITRLFDLPYGWIPSSAGMVVEGGELGRDPDSPFLAGMPHSRQSIRSLLQPSYINLFNERKRQAACIALRLDDGPRQKAKIPGPPQIDARVPRLTTEAMTLGKWKAHPITPPAALAGQYGERGASDAMLATQHAPMTEAFASGPWTKAMRELTRRYPKRFGEVWIYLGPAYRSESAKLASDIAIPDAFYAIALDLTNAGGLRALALLIPVDAQSLNLNDYITSIAQIEKLTGLQFLPELDFSIRDTLGNYVSPSVW
jgi:endonuclease G